MGNLILPPSLTRELPYAVTAQLAELPQEAQREFFEEYNRNARTASIGYVLHLLVFGTHYAYVNQWLIQFAYWFTAGGFGIWMFIDLFRIPSMIDNYNNKVADQTLKHILLKYSYRPRKPAGRFALRTPFDMQNKAIKEPSARIRHIRPIAPRLLDKPSHDPMHLSIAHLKLGCIVDFDLTTWEVVQEWQYDWENGDSEKEFRLANNSEILHLYRKLEGTQTKTVLARRTNVFSIDRDIEDEIEMNNRPPSVISYNDIDFFRENSRTGWRHEMSSKKNANKIVCWEYFDDTMVHFLRVEHIESRLFKATVGEVVSPYEFTNILMKDEEEQ